LPGELVVFWDLKFNQAKGTFIEGSLIAGNGDEVSAFKTFLIW